MKSLPASLKLLLAFSPLFALAQGPTAELAESNAYAPSTYNTTAKVEAATNPSIFAMPASIEQIDMSDFKHTIQTAIAESENNFVNIKGQPYNNVQDTFTTANCLPGSADCYIVVGNKKYYLADFGSFRSAIRASEKADDLKKLILTSIGSQQWNHSLLDKTGYVEEYQVWSKTDHSKYACIKTYIEKTGGRYKVYLTVEEI